MHLGMGTHKQHLKNGGEICISGYYSLALWMCLVQSSLCVSVSLCNSFSIKFFFHYVCLYLFGSTLTSVFFNYLPQLFEGMAKDFGWITRQEMVDSSV